jgi:agmatine deiminase
LKNMMNRRQAILGSSALFLNALTTDISVTNAAQNIIVPPEEEPHEQTFMQWPVSRQVHPDGVFLHILQQTIADIANAIAEFEPVILMAAKDNHASARKLLSGSVKLWDIPTEDLWCRDSGPLFGKTQNDQLVISHLEFNGWGDKQIHKQDSKVAIRVAERLGLPLIPSGVKGEAGAVEHDGHGLLMAHESSWVNANRNPDMTRSEIESRLLKAYGAKRMIWSDGVWGEDITDYHIDSLARFTGPGRVLINLPSKPDMNDPFHIAALNTHEALLAAKLAVDVIPEPVIRRVKSTDFVASYVNYYVCNGAVIMPQFGDAETDEMAVEALKEHYPGREIVALNVDSLGEIGGGIHCATQQMPAV